MMPQTQQNIVDILTKLQSYENGIACLKTVDETCKDKALTLFKSISERKLVLIEELHRLLS